MQRNKPKHPDLKEACVQAARKVIAEKGVEGWSMRDVARMLGISHQAPYKHFESRDHLLAEIMRRCFADFAGHLQFRSSNAPPDRALREMGEAYLEYAGKKPLEYRLMFGTPWPEPAEHTDLVRHAVFAFNVLRDHLRARHGATSASHAQADLDALFIWSTLHGMASIREANVMEHLRLSEEVEERFKEDIMNKIGAALFPPSPPKT